MKNFKQIFYTHHKVGNFLLFFAKVYLNPLVGKSIMAISKLGLIITPHGVSFLFLTQTSPIYPF